MYCMYLRKYILYTRITHLDSDVDSPVDINVLTV
jgi:hypothetical protein